MMSLFSSFDLVFFHSQKLIYIFLFFVLISKTYVSNVKNFFFKKSLSYFYTTFSMVSSKSSKLILYLVMLFLVLIMATNFSSVFSFNFPLTSQISVVLFISLAYWVSINFFFLLKNPKGFFIHMIPSGAPFYLMIFLFLVEGISNFIRFITLTVRLCANILAGHVLMILLSKLFFLYPMAAFAYMLLNIIEIMVSIIQSYIFCTMMMLYYVEIN